MKCLPHTCRAKPLDNIHTSRICKIVYLVIRSIIYHDARDFRPQEVASLMIIGHGSLIECRRLIDAGVIASGQTPGR